MNKLYEIEEQKQRAFRKKTYNIIENLGFFAGTNIYCKNKIEYYLNCKHYIFSLKGDDIKMEVEEFKPQPASQKIREFEANWA